MKYNFILLGLIIFVCQSCGFAANVQFDQSYLISRDYSPKEVAKTLTGSQLTTPDQLGRFSMSENIISAEIQPLPNQANQAAKALQSLGFRILHIGPTISVQAPRSLWESTFNVSFVPQKKTVMPEIEKGEVTYPKAITDNMRIPEHLQSVITDVMFVEPPELYF